MRFLAKFFRRWYLYVLPMIVLPILATMYGKQVLTVYESSALLHINQPIGNSSTTFSQYMSPAENGASAMNEALLSETFVVSVARNTDLASVYDLDSQYGQDAVTARIRSDVGIVASSVGQNTIFVTVDERSPHLAQQLAQQLIAQFGIYFNLSALSYDQTRIAFFSQQLKDAQAKVTQDEAHISEYLQSHPSILPTDARTDPALTTLQQQLTDDQTQVTSYNDQLSGLKFDLAAAQSGVSDIFHVEDDPQVPLSSTLHLKKLVVYPIGGLGAALALIVLIVGVQTITDRRVYSSNDLHTITENMEIDIPTIEAVPMLRGLGKRHSPRDDDAESGISGVLVPVLTVLPQLSAGQMRHELQQAVGVMVEDDE